MRYALFPESHAAHEALMRVPTPPYVYPAPEVTSRDPVPEGWRWPASVLKLRDFAERNGWEVRLQYSRGWLPHATTGKPTALRHLVALRFEAHPMTERRAYAVYGRPVGRGTWGWSARWAFGPDLPPVGLVLDEALRAYLSGGAWQ